MCGIVGLFLKDRSLEPELGGMAAGMLATLSDRGPDSAGFAVYGPGRDGQVKLSLRAGGRPEIKAAAESLAAAFPAVGVALHDTHAVVTVPEGDLPAALSWLRQETPSVEIVGSGHRMEICKEVGAPSDVAERFGLATMRGTHAVGHTRMATESAVTTNGAHPYSTGPDQCLVHNGSLSNHNNLRRELVRQGFAFSTENDSEVAAAYLTWRMREGRTLGEALEAGLNDMDGFYTFVVGTENGLGVLRDEIACKPAIMAETDRYVAFGSEYRALAGLPDIGEARVWEPEPATVYFWER
jgi:glutamate synthase domain-containing protein 1